MILALRRHVRHTAQLHSAIKGPSMPRLIIAVLWLSLLSATRVLDAATTWQFSPYLAHEANPLAAMLGGGWTTLIAVNILACLLIGWATLIWYRNPPLTEIAVRSRSTWDFAALMLYGRTMPWWRFLLFRGLMVGLPPRGFRRSYAALLGFAFPPAVTIGGLTAVAAWISIYGLRLAWANDLHRMLTTFGTVLIPAFVTWILAEVMFFRLEYRRARCVELHTADAIVAEPPG